MKKLNLICASIAVLCGSAANAGTIATATPGGTVFATENFGGAAPNQATLAIVPGAVSYNMTTITAVNAGAKIFFTVRLTNGVFAGTPDISTILFAGQAVAPVPAGPVAGAIITPSNDQTTILVEIDNGNTSTTLGLGAFTYTPGPNDIIGVNTTLGSPGGSVTGSIGVTTTAPANIESTTPLNTVDLPLPVQPIAVSATAISPSVSAMPNNTVKIDLTASPPSSKYTNNGSAALGSFKFTDTAAGANQLDGVTPYTLAAPGNTGMTVKVTPLAGAAYPIGATMGLFSNTNPNATSADPCAAATPIPGATSLITANNASAPQTLTATIPVLDYAANTQSTYLVCLTAPGSGKTASPVTSTISAVVAPVNPNNLIGTASGTGYPLVYNGQQVDIKTYWPSALSVFGYGSYVRVVNTGSVAATVSGAFINDQTGAIGVAAPLIANLPAGGATTITGSYIESQLGPVSSTDRPRLRLTAPTNSMTVQFFLQAPNGTISETNGSGAQ